MHLYRPICFINLNGNLDWDIPFCDSKNVMFYYHPKKFGMQIENSYDEINRWNIQFSVVEESPSNNYPKILSASSLRRFKL